jgi:uncharacterized protein (TIGR00661 family)
MKILYAIQGTGNGHVSRAGEIIPLLQKRCETDILISGYQSDVGVPFEVKYRLQGLSFIFGKKGGIDLRKTYSKANTRRLLQEIRELPVEDYDFVLNDFEPVSAWACYRKKIPCIALSHQSALNSRNVPKPRYKDAIGTIILKNYAPALVAFGFHFSRYSADIYTPVIRKAVREAQRTDAGHYTVYLPAYDDKTLIHFFRKIPEVEWQVFSKHNQIPMTVDNIRIQAVENEAFLTSMASSRGVLCGAGFETPAEALYLGKKLMVIPMRGQYEQKYNAVALRSLGVSVLKRLKASRVSAVKEWIESDYSIEISYPDMTDKVIHRIFEMYVEGQFRRGKWKDSYQFNLKSLLPG